MPSLNKCMIIGNVGKEPELRYTPSGTAVCNFSVAVNSKYKEEEHTEWFRITAWQKLAETCNQYLEKGKQVYVEGRLQTSTWEKGDGTTGYRTELIANQVIFLGAKGNGGSKEPPHPDAPDDEGGW